MAKTSIAHRMSAVRARAHQGAEKIERGATIGLVSFLIGVAEKKGALPITIAGVPSKPLLAALGYLAAANVKGAGKRVALASADSFVAIYSYDAAKAGSFIAGEMREISG